METAPPSHHYRKLPDDDKIWIVNWYGSVRPNSHAPSQKMIDVELVELSNGRREERNSQVTSIGAGALPQFQLGSAWCRQTRVGRAVENPKEFNTKLELKADSYRTVASYDRYAQNRYHIPPLDYPINRALSAARVARFESVNGTHVYIPCTEIARIWYLRSTLLTNHLLVGSISSAWNALVEHPRFDDLGVGIEWRTLTLKSSCHPSVAGLLSLAASSEEYRLGLATVGSPIVVARANGQFNAELEARPPFRNGEFQIDCSAVQLHRPQEEPRALLITRINVASCPVPDHETPKCKIGRRMQIPAAALDKLDELSGEDGVSDHSGARMQLAVDESDLPNQAMRGVRTSSLVGTLNGIPALETWGSGDNDREEPFSSKVPDTQLMENISTQGSTGTAKSSGKHRKLEVIENKRRKSPRMPIVESLYTIGQAMEKLGSWSNAEFLHLGLGEKVELKDDPEDGFATEIHVGTAGLDAKQVNWINEGGAKRCIAALRITQNDWPVYLVEVEPRSAGLTKPVAFKLLLARPWHQVNHDCDALRQTALDCRGVWPKEIDGFDTYCYLHTWPNVDHIARRIDKHVSEWATKPTDVSNVSMPPIDDPLADLEFLQQ